MSTLPTRVYSFLPGLLGAPHKKTSESTEHKTPTYNCIAWAAGDDLKWWEPDGINHWPSALPAVPTDQCGLPSQSVIDMFNQHLGYEVCSSPDHEDGQIKLAVYCDGDEFLHVARQLPDGGWTSKLGHWEDVWHDDLECLEGKNYGSAVIFMRKASNG